MPQIQTSRPGLALVWSLDRASAEFASDLALLKRTLAALQAKEGFDCFIPLVEEDGEVLTISIIPAMSADGGGAAMLDAAIDSLVDRRLTDVSSLLDEGGGASVDLDDVVIP